jgi:hypothetical protein
MAGEEYKRDAKEWDYSKTWYHGSPVRLNTISKGSTITQDRDIARVFSHKPHRVSLGDGTIKHDGVEPGFLYRIAEDIGPDDVYPHPRSSMEWGEEWLTSRVLRVLLIGPVEIRDEERLTREEIAWLEEKLKSRD